MSRLPVVAALLLAASAAAERLSDPLTPAVAAWAPRHAEVVGAEVRARPAPWSGDRGELSRTSEHLAEVLGLRGGAVPGASDLVEVLGTRGGAIPGVPALASLMHRLWPLLERVDAPVRIALMSWAVLDKSLRAAQTVIRDPLRDRERYLMTVAGAELHAIQAMKEIIGQAEIAGDDTLSRVARALQLEAVGKLAQSFARGVQDSADFALTVTAKSFRRAGRAGPVLRITDAVGAPAKCVDLSRRALREADRMDVAGELVPKTWRARAKLSLLGLVAALGHEAVFQRVQAALRPSHAKGPGMTVKDFLRLQGVDNAADLVRSMFHKYRTPRSLMTTYLALYSAVSLRFDPLYYQVAWSMRLGALSVKQVPPTTNQSVSPVFDLAELIYRGGQVVTFLIEEARGEGNPWDRLRLVHAFLSVVLVP